MSRIVCDHGREIDAPCVDCDREAAQHREGAAARIAELEAALREIADGYSADEDGRPQAFRFSQIARKALSN